FPGAFPTIWCSLRSLPKEVQRGTVQPFILIMQVATLAYFSKLGIFSMESAKTVVWCAPAVLGGTWIGIRIFRRVDDVMFRRILLVFLLVSGAALIYPSAL
ncbi:MAG: sulfite exporter TauE/SafE family protein, partial [Xanthobacteraceae bacterium]